MNKWPDETMAEKMCEDARLVDEHANEGSAAARCAQYVEHLIVRVRTLEKQNLLYRAACEAFRRYTKSSDANDDIQAMLDYAEAEGMIREALEEDK